MTSGPRIAAIAFVALAASIGAARATDAIRYDVHPDFAAKQVEVTITVPNVTDPAVRFQLPVWSPGAYFASDTSGNLVSCSAADGANHALNVHHPDRQMWEVEANGAPVVRFTYRIKDNDLVVADGKPERGHIQGPHTYLYVVGRKQMPTELAVRVPASFGLATSLDPTAKLSLSSDETSWQFTAPTYDVLADGPIEMGDFDEQDFSVSGVPFRVVLYGKYDNVDRPKLKNLCQRVAETETSFFHDIPFKRYVFMFRASGGTRGGAGGLEHLGSTEISLLGPVDDRARFVIAHEFFHVWNVKRIRPFVLGPFDYINPPHTANLWWSEGLTDYYARLLSRRGGLNTDDEFLKDLGQTITDLENNPAHLKVSADESSLRVWEANNSQGNGLSYYTKGDLVGLCLDLKIRHLTNNQHNLDDVMHALWIQCGKGLGPGFGEDDIEKTVNRVAGKNLCGYYAELARSADEMPLAECLGYAGIKVATSDKPEMIAYNGMSLRPGEDYKWFTVRTVDADGPASKAGLQRGDRIVAVNGQPLGTPDSFRAFRGAKPGESFTFTVERDGQNMQVPFTVGSEAHTPYTLSFDPATTPDQARLRASWLMGS